MDVRGITHSSPSLLRHVAKLKWICENSSYFVFPVLFHKAIFVVEVDFMVAQSSGASWMDFELVPFHHTWLVVQVLRCYVLHGLAASPSELFSSGGGEDARANGRAELAACGHASTCNRAVGEPAVTVLGGFWPHWSLPVHPLGAA
ncbi:uncharacterized protein [Triticum aestivum]|uniref:uncharacterized protein isoform X2 n=1 Tax=Triticum aestivum TaxID=4565 RepID=UPI001D004ABE|nr:uncharacterized protein LOC123061404 isoform X2 [Triticum aestivum]